MALESQPTASLISAKELPDLVSRAIKDAGHVDGVGGLVVRWDLIGRILREEAQAHDFATSVAKSVTALGHPATPAVLKIDNTVIAGFFERIAVPQIRNF